MIRDAVREDINEIRELLIEDAKEKGWEEQSGMEIDPHTIDAILRYHIRHKDAAVFVSERDEKIVGFFIAALQPFLLDIRRHAAHEKGSGGEDLDELWSVFKAWAKKEDAPCTVRGCYGQDPSPRLRRIE